MTSLQELLRLLSFLDRSWEYGVPVPLADVPVSSEVEVVTGRFLFSGTTGTSHTLDLIIRLENWTDTHEIDSLQETADFFSNSSLSSLSPSVSKPNYDSSDAPLAAVCRNNVVSFSDFCNINYWCIFSLQKHLRILIGLAHQLESDMDLYILHLDVHAYVHAQVLFCSSDAK